MQLVKFGVYARRVRCSLAVSALVFLNLFYGFSFLYLVYNSFDFILKGRIDAIAKESPYKLGHLVLPVERRYFLSGWSGVKSWGVWAVGDHASLVFPLGQKPNTKLKLTARVSGITTHQRTVVYANGGIVAEWAFPEGAVVERTALIPNKMISDTAVLLVDFKFCCPAVPGSTDPRLLAMGLAEVRLQSVSSDPLLTP